MTTMKIYDRVNFAGYRNNVPVVHEEDLRYKIKGEALGAMLEELEQRQANNGKWYRLYGDDFGEVVVAVENTIRSADAEKLQEEYDEMIEKALIDSAIEGYYEMPGEWSAFWDPEPGTV